MNATHTTNHNTLVQNAPVDLCLSTQSKVSKKPWSNRYPLSLKKEVLFLLGEKTVKKSEILKRFLIGSYTTLRRWEQKSKEILGLVREPKTFIKNTGTDQGQMLRDILTLHCKSGIIDLDATASICQIYKDAQLPLPRHLFDIKPQTKNTIKASATDLPLPSASINSTLFDPPFVVGSGKSITEPKAGSNLIIQRFGCFANMKELWKFYAEALKEQYRVLKDDGILIIKCQDVVAGGKNCFSSHHIHYITDALGFTLVDKFVLLNNSRMISGKWKNQHHARKHTCYFLVFKKCKSKVDHFGLTFINELIKEESIKTPKTTQRESIKNPNRKWI